MITDQPAPSPTDFVFPTPNFLQSVINMHTPLDEIIEPQRKIEKTKKRKAKKPIRVEDFDAEPPPKKLCTTGVPKAEQALNYLLKNFTSFHSKNIRENIVAMAYILSDGDAHPKVWKKYLKDFKRFNHVELCQIKQ